MSYHHNFYRYIRMMLRRYPKMRWERLAWGNGPGIDAICGNTLDDRLRAARQRGPNNADLSANRN